MDQASSHAQKPSKRIFYLDVARAIAIISIITLHAINRSFDNYDNTQLEFETICFFSTFIKAALTIFGRVGVPLFLMISGALILRKSFDKPGSLERFYKHNVLSLFITAEIWYVIFFWFIVLVNPENMMLENSNGLDVVMRFIQTLLFQNQVSMDSMWYMSMILGTYLVLPFFCVAKDKLPRWAFFIPMGVVVLNTFFLTSLNAFLRVIDFPTFGSAISQTYVISWYLFYILLGYFISCGMFEKFSTKQVVLVVFLIYGIDIAAQIFYYASPSNYLISYHSFGIFALAMMCFELIRRSESIFLKFEKPIILLSAQSFALYFVHIVLMSLLEWYFVLPWAQPINFLVYEVIAIFGGLLIIHLFKRIPFVGKYVFSLKG